MQLRDELDLLRTRVSILSYGVAVILGVLVFGFWQLQVVQSSHYSDLAEKNRIKEIRLVAPRGKIYDRNHKILADNRPSYNIVYVRENSPHTVEETVACSVNGLGMSAEELTQKINRKKKGPALPADHSQGRCRSRGRCVRHGSRATNCRKSAWNFSRAVSIAKATVAAHALGYIGEVSEAQLQDSPDLKPRDQVGIAGLELVYDSVLRGIDGSRHVVVNNSGREIETLPDEVKPIARTRSVYDNRPGSAESSRRVDR